MMMFFGALILAAVQDLPSRSLPAHPHATQQARYTPDGKLLVTHGLPDRTLKVWLTSTSKILYTLAEKVECAAIRPDGGLVAVGEASRTTVWSLASGEQVHALDTGRTGALGWSPDGKALTTVTFRRGGLDVRIWDFPGAQSRKPIVIPLLRDPAWAAVSPDGATVAVPHENQVRIWDIAKDRVILELAGHADKVTALAFSPDGGTAATASGDQTVRFWEVSSGKELRRLSGGYSGATQIAFSRDGALAAVSAEAGIEIWDVKSGKRPEAIYGGPGTGVWTPSCLDFSPDGRTLAAGGTLIAKDASASGRVSGPVYFWKRR